MSLEGRPKCLTVSRITPHRNIDSIILSVRKLVEKLPETMLYIVGAPVHTPLDRAERSYPMKVSRLIEDTGVQNNVRLLGALRGDALWQFYSACDIFLYASSYDNFGFALLEAAYFGLPIVSTDVGIASELIKDGKGGRIVSRNDPDEIAVAAEEILSNPKLGGSMSEYLRNEARNYTIEKNCQQYIDLYEGLCHSRMR